MRGVSSSVREKFETHYRTTALCKANGQGPRQDKRARTFVEREEDFETLKLTPVLQRPWIFNSRVGVRLVR